MRSSTVFLLSAIAAAAIVVPRAGLEGRVGRVEPSKRPAVEAAFTRESYGPGDIALLRLFDRARFVRLQVFRAGTETVALRARDVMRGTPVSPAVALVGARWAAVPVGDWPSGLYFARLRATGGRVGYAPFVVRPEFLGVANVAVVLPTLTWQAYNFRDDDHDGDADTWYADPASTVRLARPFENRGVPPHYKHYDQPFLRWLRESGRDADYLAQSDLERVSGSHLAAVYDLIVFPGHHEYVTDREYDAVESYRNRGGNLMFLSANNFFWKVVKRAGVMRRVAHWRDLGRPEAGLVGVQYIGNDEGEHRGAWVVTRAGARHWVFARIGVREESDFSNGGIEIDKTAPSSPPGTRVLAEIRDLLGPGKTGQMTYYETRRGAKVFAAGAFTLAGAVRQPSVRLLLENVWDRLSAGD
jgi:hypothetical protein